MATSPPRRGRTPDDVHAQRLRAQRIAAPADDVAAAVAALCAVQAQDYAGSLWALGLRTHGATLADIERAVAERRIVRSWPMRGTLHWVATDDLRWLLALLAPRAVALDAARLLREHGLDARAFDDARRIAERALRDGPAPRDALYAAWQRAGIATERQRGTHLILRLAQTGVLCQAARIGAQAGFALVDAWLPPHTGTLARDEALARLATRYFAGHGPAGVQDLAWWAGLTLGDARIAIAAAGDALARDGDDTAPSWRSATAAPAATRRERAFLLPPFDEYLLGYRDRAALNDADVARVVGRNGLYAPVIVADGRVVGTWKRTASREGVAVAFEPFAKTLPRAHLPALRAAARRYAEFFGVSVLLA